MSNIATIIVFVDGKEYASRKYYKPEPMHPVDPEPGVYNRLAEIFIVTIFFQLSANIKDRIMEFMIWIVIVKPVMLL